MPLGTSCLVITIHRKLQQQWPEKGVTIKVSNLSGVKVWVASSESNMNQLAKDEGNRGWVVENGGEIEHLGC